MEFGRCGHASMHPPQLLGSVVVLTHEALEQAVSPGAHAISHIPIEHTNPRAHCVVQLPQWFGSELVSTQVPLQSVCIAGQPHAPPTQTSLAAHALVQVPQ
jgi:hypothetical protein